MSPATSGRPNPPSQPALRTAPARVLSTLNQDGSRRWLTPRPSPGRFLTARRWVAIALIVVFTVLPYLKINGKPAILLDVVARRFTVMGTTFLPTDTLLLALLMVTVFVTVFALTALLGRVWCGWACPQTVYMEFLFRPIERLFHGTPGRRAQGSFKGSPLAMASKWAVYFVLALFLAHTFLAYFVGIERLALWVQQSPFEHPAGFIIVFATTGLMLFDFGWFREQVCTIACPYGRFQSVMLDQRSLIVTYDRARGEPRGKARSKPRGDVMLDILPSAESASRIGDCVDCGLCVTTCPTGIDIRDGLQMECIGCAQCIDACDEVMERLNRKRGLIRYSSQAALAGRPTRIIRPRVLVYLGLLIALVTTLAVVLNHRGPAMVTVLRGLGSTFTELNDGSVANNARVKITNRTDEVIHCTISVDGVPGAFVNAAESSVQVAPLNSATVPITITAPREAFRRGKRDIILVVTTDDGPDLRVQHVLLGPSTAEAHDADEPEAANGEEIGNGHSSRDTGDS